MTPFDLDDLRFQHAQLRRVARAIVGESDADDVVQDAWAAALARPGPAPGHWGRWLNRVTHNLAWKRRLRAERGSAHALEVDRDRETPSPDDAVAEIEAKHALERAILELDEPYRSVLLWRYYEGLSIAEVSRRAGTVPSTTRTHLQRGLERLRARLQSERGPEWRLALVPFLRREPVAAHAAAHGLLAGAWTMTWMKWTLASAVALATLLLFGREAGYFFERPAAPAVEVEPLHLARTPSAKTNAPSTAAVAPRVTLEAERGAPDPAAASPARETVIALVDGASGQPLRGVTVHVRYSVLKRRLFQSHTEQVEVVRVTNDRGRAMIPVRVDAEGRAAGNSVMATVELDSLARNRIYCSSAGLGDDGTLRLEAAGAAFRVRLPEALPDAAAAQLTATLLSRDARDGLQVWASSVRPAAIHGRDLLMILPDHILRPGGFDGGAGILKIAALRNGPSFEASFERLPGLTDAPIPARRCDDITHVFRVVDASTAEPLGGVRVSVHLPSSSPWPVDRVAGSITDAEGTVGLIGIPPGEVAVVVREDGYEPYEESTTLSAGGASELALQPIGGLREVALSIDSGGGEAPVAIWCNVIDRDGDVLHQGLAKIAEGRSSWRASAVLEHVPGHGCFLEIDVAPRIYAGAGPIRIEPETTELEVDLGPQIPLEQVVLRLPLDANAQYRQRVGSGRLYAYPSRHSGLSPVALAPDDGRPVTWVIDAPGYVPVHGTEKDWKRTTFEGERCIEIAPDLVRGWGALIGATSIGTEEGVPFRFRTETPVPGVSIVDPATGETLGVTDETGCTVITSASPLGRIQARYGDEVHTLDLGGGRGAVFGFSMDGR